MGPGGKAGAALRELTATVRAFKQRMYPGFVYGKPLGEELPVFVYHHIGARELTGHLEYLSANGYRPVTADEMYEYLVGKVPYSGQVMVTFDDGFADLYTVVYPLLKRYHVPAVVYLIPGWMNTEGMLTWEEIKEMHGSGLVDFQSHSMHHAAMFIGPEIRGVFRSAGGSRWNQPFYRKDFTLPPEGGAEPGNPVFSSGSRYSDALRFNPDARFLSAFTVLSAAGGKGIKETLKQTAGMQRGDYESEEEQRAVIKREIELSRECIERELPDKEVRHFAFPWFSRGAVTRDVLEKCGFRTAAVGMSADRRSNLPGDDPFNLVRVSGDFIPALPGKKRIGFIPIMTKKMIRRLFKGSTA